MEIQQIGSFIHLISILNKTLYILLPLMRSSSFLLSIPFLTIRQWAALERE